MTVYRRVSACGICICRCFLRPAVACRTRARPQVIECDPICIVQRRGNNEFDGGWQEVFRTGTVAPAPVPGPI